MRSRRYVGCLFLTGLVWLSLAHGSPLRRWTPALGVIRLNGRPGADASHATCGSLTNEPAHHHKCCFSSIVPDVIQVSTWTIRVGLFKRRTARTPADKCMQR